MDADRFNTQASRAGCLSRGGAAGAMSARVLKFPRNAAVEMAATSEQLVRVGHRKLLVRRSGVGPPVLLLPGMGMPLTAWDPLLPYLHGFECIEVAMPGGGNLAPYPVLTMPGFAELARGLLDRFDIARADVIGLSFGGLVAQQLAHDAPTRVGGLVLASTSCGWGGLPVNPVSWWDAVLSGGRPTSAGQAVQQLANYWPWHLLRRVGAGWSTGRRLAGLAEEVIAASLWSSQPWLPELDHQTLVITGTADAVVPAVNASVLASAIPRARLHRVNRGGHMCLLDRAAEIGPVVAAFLRSLERTPVNEAAELS